MRRGRPSTVRARVAALAMGAAVVAAVVVVLAVIGHGSGSSHRHTAGRAARALPARPAPAVVAFGAAVNRLFNDSPGPSAASVAASLRALRATGATLARADALWEAAQPAAPAAGAPARYDWTFDDAIADALATAGLRWLPVLDYTAPWEQSVPGQDHSPPRHDAAFAAWARAFAARYGTGGTFWSDHAGLAARPVTVYEIWNEPDNAQFWAPSPDPARYGALYGAARAAIDATDPGARVIVGGLVHPATFLPVMLHADPGLAGHLDGVAIHPYGTPGAVSARVTGARAALRAVGQPAVPLYVTEFGWTSSPPSSPAYAPAARRPALLRATLARLRASDDGVAAVVLYAWYTPGGSPEDGEQWYGISGDPAAVAAFRDGLRSTG